MSWEKGHFLKFQLEKRLKNLIQDYVICMYLRKAVFECGFLSLFKLLLFLLKLCVFVTSHTLFSNIRQAFRGETQERGEGHTVHCSVQWDTREGRGWHQIWREIVRSLSYTFCDRKNAVFCANIFIYHFRRFLY